jgi:hypothetical protein
MAPRGTIAVAGSVAQKPRHGGHTWVFLQYLLGFRRLGWDVLFLDRLDPAACTDDAGAPCPPGESKQIRFLAGVMKRFGLGRSYCLLLGAGPETVGLSRAEAVERVRRSVVLLNIMGFLRDPEVLAAAPRRVFLDIDPGFGQMWRELEQADVVAGHDAFVTIGENVGRPGCLVPTGGLDWTTTPQPVVLDHWPATSPPADGPLTSVASWRGAYGPVEYRGTVYGLRVHEFRKFAGLPRRCPYHCRIALDIHPSEAKDLALLAEQGWELADPRRVAGDPWAYQTFIRDSAAEFMVAKGMYVQTACGWLSDRSLCYLATGRPVLAQDTGLRDLYPTGQGLITFATPDEAVAAAEELRRNYPCHARAARALAEEYFDSDRVLGRLLDRLGVD